MHSFLRFVSLREDFKTAQQKFLQSNPDVSPQDISKAFTQFRQLSSQNKLKGDEKNIDWWAKQGWDSFSKFVNNQVNIASDSKYKDQVTLRDDDEWLIVVPTNRQASCFHGSGTDWCTTKVTQNYFHQYFYDNNVTLVYCIQKKTKKKWAIARYANGRLEFFDSMDSSIRLPQFESQTGLDIRDIDNMVAQQQSVIDARREHNKQTDLGYLLSNYDILNNDQKNYIQSNLPRIVKNAQYAYQYAKNVIEKEFPEGEPAIAKNPELSYWYAKIVLEGKFPAGEKAIAKDLRFAYEYAHNILKGPFPAGEPTIAKDANKALEYAYRVLEGPFPAGEPVIATNPAAAFHYAAYVMKAKDVPPVIEQGIAMDAGYANYYVVYLRQNNLPVPKIVLDATREY